MGGILLVEDDSNLADAIGMLLPSYGYDVRIARDGETALVEVERVTPDAVLLDIGLPLLDGFEVARRIRRLCGAGLRLVAYTARSDVTPRELEDAGFDDMVVKPASLERLLRAIATPRR